MLVAVVYKPYKILKTFNNSKRLGRHIRRPPVFIYVGPLFFISAGPLSAYRTASTNTAGLKFILPQSSSMPERVMEGMLTTFFKIHFASINNIPAITHVISINNIPAITHVQILHGDSHFSGLKACRITTSKTFYFHGLCWIQSRSFSFYPFKKNHHFASMRCVTYYLPNYCLCPLPLKASR